MVTLLGKDTNVLSFIIQFPDLNPQDDLSDTTTAHVLCFSLPVTSVIIAYKNEGTCDSRRQQQEHASKNKRTKVGEIEVFGVHLVSL